MKNVLNVYIALDTINSRSDSVRRWRKRQRSVGQTSDYDSPVICCSFPSRASVCPQLNTKAAVVIRRDNHYVAAYRRTICVKCCVHRAAPRRTAPRDAAPRRRASPLN